jgi:membrane protein involved in colicin uptake
MNVILKVTAAAAAIAGLSACDMLGLNRNDNAGGNATNTVSAGNTTSNASADTGGKDPAAAGGNAASTAAAPFTGEVTRHFLVGRWTDNNDCTSTIEFRVDGRFVAPTGEGLWVLDGERLTFQGGRTISARVQAPDANTIMLIHDDGTVGRSTRCT